MGILNKFKGLFNKKKRFIYYYDLENWWENEFSQAEREYILSLKPKDEDDYINKTPAEYLRFIYYNLNIETDIEIKIKLLDKADKMVEKDSVFLYSPLIKELYKKRNEDDKYIDLCIKYCKKDIELYIDKLRHMYPYKDKNTRIPAFQRLAIIYEKRKEYEKAIRVCKKAIKYNMREKNKDNFEDRLERLQSKLGAKK